MSAAINPFANKKMQYKIQFFKCVLEQQVCAQYVQSQGAKNCTLIRFQYSLGRKNDMYA